MSFSAEDVAEFGADNPMGRPAQPAELAPAYVFLASDESRFVVGEVIGVTGGKLMPSWFSPAIRQGIRSVRTNAFRGRSSRNGSRQAGISHARVTSTAADSTRGQQVAHRAQRVGALVGSRTVIGESRPLLP